MSEKVSWHFTVDDHNIYQHLPCEESAFHAGDGSGDGNRKSIGIEICTNSDGSILGATDLAIALVKELMAKYNIPVSNIKQHNYWSGKNCPSQLRANIPYSWNEFLMRCADTPKEKYISVEELKKMGYSGISFV